MECAARRCWACGWDLLDAERYDQVWSGDHEACSAFAGCYEGVDEACCQYVRLAAGSGTAVGDPTLACGWQDRGRVYEER